MRLSWHKNKMYDRHSKGWIRYTSWIRYRLRYIGVRITYRHNPLRIQKLVLYYSHGKKTIK